MPRADLILFTPGPVRIPTLVAEYLAHPPCNYHRQDAFTAMFADTERDLKRLVGIRSPDSYFATIMTATGTGANEACILALEGLGKGLLCSNGFFGDRVIDQATQDGIDDRGPQEPPRSAARPRGDRRRARRGPVDQVGVLRQPRDPHGPEEPVRGDRPACKSRGRMVAADAISSAYAYAIDIEASQCDLVTASSAKAIMAAPGLGIIFTNKASIPTLEKLPKPRGYYLDVVAEYKKQSSEMQTRFAQPVALHAALRAACLHLGAQGVEAHMARIQRQMQTLIDFMAKLGLEPLLDAKYRSNIAVNFRLPVGLAYKDFAKRMEEQGYFCLYGIPGDQTHFQLSTIGDLTDDHIRGVQQALTRVFER